MSPVTKFWIFCILPAVVSMSLVSWYMATAMQAENLETRRLAGVACDNTCKVVHAEMVTFYVDHFQDWHCSCFNPRTEGVSEFVVEP